MTNERHDPTDDWALASAYLDGEADEHERALVEADPARRELVDRLTRVRAQLAAPVVPPAGARDGAIAAALGALDQQPAAAAAPATVSSLDHRRRRRMQWFAGAAAAAVIALLVGLVVRSDDDHGSTAVSKAPPTTNVAVASRTETESAATDAAATAADAAPSAGGAVPAPAAATTTATPALIALDDPGQLLDLVAANDRPAAAVATTTCTAPGEVVLATITYRGTLAVATFDPAAHVRRARSLADCAVLAEIAATS